ncbi:uncharacterized protein MYCFIDRAFT_9246, partial [Pseudocercospora fijiensis CIRAD86]
TSSEVITRDVAILGGGPSGTYAAVGLRDKGKSVVIVEKEAVLGGNVASYLVPSTAISVEVGVYFLNNAPTLRKFFSRFNLGLNPV